MLIAARFLQGAGGGAAHARLAVGAPGQLPPDDRGRAIGAWAGLSGVSTALGPFIGGWLIDTLSWRWIFFLNLPLAVLVVLAALRWVPESRDESASRTRGRVGPDAVRRRRSAARRARAGRRHLRPDRRAGAAASTPARC